MKSWNGAGFLLLIHISLIFPHVVNAASVPTGVQPQDSRPQAEEWTSHDAKHVYGLPDAKANQEGTLTLSATDFSFTGKTSNYTIPRLSVIAVSAGNQRVEIWGIKGRILRMAIPSGGGVAAAMFMHHRVDMLTVEFTDGRGGYHGAVFLLPAKEATRALESFSKTPIVPHEFQANICKDNFVRPHSLLLSTPSWDQVEVPAAYRALVYERLLDRLRQVKGVEHVYRDGENNPQQGCAQYTMQLSISGFKEGNQVKRAIMGPAGLFVSTTQMKFDATVTDASGKVGMQQQIKATTRGETESTSVATNVAKDLAKHYAAMLKKSAETNMATPAGTQQQ